MTTPTTQQLRALDPPLEGRIGPRLVGTRTFGSGVVLLRYEAAGG
jgi:hypothetical protein